MKSSSIITLIKDKDEKGLSILYDKYAPVLYGIILRIIKSEPLAEEILQQTFLKIWNNIDTYEESKSTLFTWMSSIARNAAIDKYRLKSFKDQKKIESIDINVHNNSTQEISTAKMDMEAILKDIPEKYKTVIYHIYILGYTHKETAQLLELPLGTVKTRLRYAIGLLRKNVKKNKTMFLGSLFLLIFLSFIL